MVFVHANYLSLQRCCIIILLGERGLEDAKYGGISSEEEEKQRASCGSLKTKQ